MLIPSSMFFIVFSVSLAQNSFLFPLCLNPTDPAGWGSRILSPEQVRAGPRGLYGSMVNGNGFWKEPRFES